MRNLLLLLLCVDVPLRNFSLFGSLFCCSVSLSQLEQDQRPQCKYLTEYFGLLLDFARMGDIECKFLHGINAISIIVNFFTGHKQQENYVCIYFFFGWLC